MDAKCHCEDHSGRGVQIENLEKKQTQQCYSTTNAHKRIDDAEKRFLPSNTFWKSIVIIIAVVGGVIGYQTHVLNKLVDTVQKVDKGQAVLTEKIDQLETRIDTLQ